MSEFFLVYLISLAANRWRCLEARAVKEVVVVVVLPARQCSRASNAAQRRRRNTSYSLDEKSNRPEHCSCFERDGA